MAQAHHPHSRGEEVGEQTHRHTDTLSPSALTVGTVVPAGRTSTSRSGLQVHLEMGQMCGLPELELLQEKLNAQLTTSRAWDIPSVSVTQLGATSSQTVPSLPLPGIQAPTPLPPEACTQGLTQPDRTHFCSSNKPSSDPGAAVWTTAPPLPPVIHLLIHLQVEVVMPLDPSLPVAQLGAAGAAP